MEQSAAPPPPPAPEEDAQLASRGELRSLRRWLAVAGVWALAATAVAVIALIKATDQHSDSRADVSRQIGDAEQALDHRIDSLRSRIDTLPTSQDLTRVDDRLKRAEDEAGRASKDEKTTSSKL